MDWLWSSYDSSNFCCLWRTHIHHWYWSLFSWTKSHPENALLSSRAYDAVASLPGSTDPSAAGASSEVVSFSASTTSDEAVVASFLSGSSETTFPAATWGE